MFSLFFKLSTYVFWRAVNAIHKITPKELDLMGEALTGPIEGLNREQRWSPWSDVSEENSATVAGK